MVGACHWAGTHQLCKTLSRSLIIGRTFRTLVAFDNRTLIRIAHHIKSHYPPAVNQFIEASFHGVAPSFTNSPDYIQSLDRGLQVLRAFNRERPRCTLSEIAAQIGLSRAVARRSLLTLQHLGYVAAQGRQFFLTPRVLELGYSYLSSLDLTELAHEAMEQLSQRVGESCSMAVLDGSEIVYVARVAVRRLMSVALGVGARLPAFAASMGRVLLADKSDSELTAWLRENTFRPITAHTIYKTASAASGNPEGAPPRLRVRLARAGAGTVLDRGAGSFRYRTWRCAVSTSACVTATMCKRWR